MQRSGRGPITPSQSSSPLRQIGRTLRRTNHSWIERSSEALRSPVAVLHDRGGVTASDPSGIRQHDRYDLNDRQPPSVIAILNAFTARTLRCMGRCRTGLGLGPVFTRDRVLPDCEELRVAGTLGRSVQAARVASVRPVATRVAGVLTTRIRSRVCKSVGEFDCCGVHGDADRDCGRDVLGPSCDDPCG